MATSKVIIFGGNGFVGTTIAEVLVQGNITPVCVSRTGSKPQHLQTQDWAKQVAWVRGDANKPDPALFENVQAVISLVGTPPVPTFSKSAYQRQLDNNSKPNLAVINATLASGVTRLVILGAHIPALINTDKFAYAKGKRLCLEAAQEFASCSDKHTAVVLQPSAIYGIRHSKAGRALNIGFVMKPIAKLQSIMPSFIKALMPEQLVPVETVARSAVRGCFDQEFAGKFTVVSNQQIISTELDSRLGKQS